MKKIFAVFIAFSICVFTSCGKNENVFMDVDFTPWIEKQEGYIVSRNANGFSNMISDTEGALSALMDVDIGKQIDYTGATDPHSDLVNVNGTYGIILNDMNSGEMKGFYFLDDCNVLMVINNHKAEYYNISNNQEIRNYFATTTDYISVEKYAKMMECINSVFTPDNIQNLGLVQEEPVELPYGLELHGSSFTIQSYGAGTEYSIGTSLVDYNSAEYKFYPVIMTMVCDDAGNFTLKDVQILN